MDRTEQEHSATAFPSEQRGRFHGLRSSPIVDLRSPARVFVGNMAEGGQAVRQTGRTRCQTIETVARTREFSNYIPVNNSSRLPAFREVHRRGREKVL